MISEVVFAILKTAGIVAIAWLAFLLAMALYNLLF